MSGATPISVELKHRLYEESVQNHEADLEFMEEQFEHFRKRKPRTVREDFGGTAAMACDWVALHPENRAWGIDLDPEPMKYGQENHYQRLTDEQKTRMKYIEGNVLEDFDFKADIIAAFNFSYFIFKKRAQLLEYFKKAYAGLNDDGIFMVDIFGGTECYEEQEEETEHDNHSYFWDCDKFNPLTSECLYYIHFKTHEDGKKYEKVFTYDWRHWTPIEIKELMEEAGFSEVYTYWEGEDEDGDGDGEFTLSDNEENCESWVIYIAGLK
ncbi:MAG: ubiquinone/menaquinone biosynthesis C-methylase UbiE [Bacteriovoracaceae bacterium]|jgi:ubiquinone/menaquinone biosynthesis C-methylase UbiE